MAIRNSAEQIKTAKRVGAALDDERLHLAISGLTRLLIAMGLDEDFDEPLEVNGEIDEADKRALTLLLEQRGEKWTRRRNLLQGHLQQTRFWADGFEESLSLLQRTRESMKGT